MVAWKRCRFRPEGDSTDRRQETLGKLELLRKSCPWLPKT
jgi:hypothetical protein